MRKLTDDDWFSDAIRAGVDSPDDLAYDEWKLIAKSFVTPRQPTSRPWVAPELRREQARETIKRLASE